MNFHQITLTVNGSREIVQVAPNMTLLTMLRENLGLTGTKNGCTTGECGACTVLFNGEPLNACLVLAVEANDAEIVTIEGLGSENQLATLQQAFIDHNGTQCGFCIPGVLMSAQALLNRNPNPDEAEIKDALRGNLCRCTGYINIIKAIKATAEAGGGD